MRQVCSLATLLAVLLMAGCDMEVNSKSMLGVGRWITVRSGDLVGPNLAAMYFQPEVKSELKNRVAYGAAVQITPQAGPGPLVAMVAAGGQIGAAAALRPDQTNVTQAGGGGSADASSSTTNNGNGKKKKGKKKRKPRASTDR